MNLTLFDFSVQNGREHLLEEWDTERNLPLTPSQVTFCAKKKVWWSCRNGHNWEAAIYSRSEGSGCPICANRKVVPGINDLATTHPEIARQWHPTKNEDLTPQQVTHGTFRKVWWLCDNNHSWYAYINSRVKGSGCPYCSNKLAIPGENDLASRYPDIAAQWLQSKNKKLRPEQIVFGSNRIVWWQCEKGHQWRASIVLRTQRGYGCPYCASRYLLTGFNDLEYLRPDIAREWHPTLNGDLTPDQVTVASNRKVWWQCFEGHVWKTAIYNRTAARQTNCPVCAGNITSAKRRYYERIASEAILQNKAKPKGSPSPRHPR